jgi:hypothetical protein
MPGWAWWLIPVIPARLGSCLLEASIGNTLVGLHQYKQPGMMVHTCNPSYAGRRITVQGKNVRSYLKTKAKGLKMWLKQ